MKTILPFIVLLMACSDPPPAPEPAKISTSSSDPAVELADTGPVQLPLTAPMPSVPRPDPPCTSCPLGPVSPH